MLFQGTSSGPFSEIKPSLERERERGGKKNVDRNLISMLARSVRSSIPSRFPKANDEIGS